MNSSTPASISADLTTPAVANGAEAWSPALGRLLEAMAGKQAALLGIKDASDGRFLYVNQALADFYGKPATEVIGHHDSELLDTQLAAVMRAADQTALAHGTALVSDHRFDWAGDRQDWQVLRLVTQANGRRVLCCLWLNQVTNRQREAQLRAAIDQLEQEQKARDQMRGGEVRDHTLRDTATGLYTRAHFEDQLRREVDLSTREHREFALVFVELDPYSDAVNALGDRARQRVLEAMGRLLRSNTRVMDASCRFGERRFAVLLSGVGLATAHARMEGLRRQCATQIVVLEGQELGFTVSMGVASFPHTAHSLDELLNACEATLREAKRRKGNTVTLASIRFDQP
jgi:diguanylate cyclase (GGDEF)-like protein